MIPLLFSLFTLWLAEGAFVLGQPQMYARFTGWLVRGSSGKLAVTGSLLTVAGCLILASAWQAVREWAYVINLAGLPLLFWGLMQLGMAAAGADAREAFARLLEHIGSDGLRKHAIWLTATGAVGLLALAAVAG